MNQESNILVYFFSLSPSSPFSIYKKINESYKNVAVASEKQEEGVKNNNRKKYVAKSRTILIGG